MNKKQGRLFYGWYVVFACFLIMGVSVGLINNSSGVYVKPVCADMGFSRKAMAFNSTLIAASSMVVAVFAGKIYARFDVKHVMRFGGLAMGLGYMSYSLAQNLPMFYLSSVICGFSQALLTTVSISMLISNWFHARRGSALGAASMGSGVGGMICNPLAAWLIQQAGWRQTYLMLGAAILIIVAPACFFIVRTRPQDMGLQPYGEAPAPAEDVLPTEQPGLTARQARRTWQFWALAACNTINSLCAVSLVQNSAPHLSDVGLSAIAASAVASAMMASLAVGKFLLGWLFDRWGVRKASLFANLCMIMGLLGMVMAPFLPALAMIVLGAGLGGAFGAVATTLLADRLFGAKEFAAILGSVSAVSSLGAMVGPIAINSVYDVLGSYKPAMAFMALLMALALLGYRFVLAHPPALPQPPQTPARQ